MTRGDGGSYGGAIDTQDGTLTVTNARLEDNEADLLGGAIRAINTNVEIKNSVFVGNFSGSLGGAMTFHSIDPFHDDWTEDMESKTLLIDQTTFGEDVPDGCAAADISADPENEAAANGGAIHASPWSFLFENNTVSCNAADADGGGIYVTVGDLILRHSRIYQNTAGDEGGGRH